MCNTAGQVEHGELIVSADIQGFVNDLHARGLDKQQILRRIFAGEDYWVAGRQTPNRGFAPMVASLTGGQDGQMKSKGSPGSGDSGADPR